MLEPTIEPGGSKCYIALANWCPLFLSSLQLNDLLQGYNFILKYICSLKISTHQSMENIHEFDAYHKYWKK